MNGTVEHIFITANKREPMVAVEVIQVTPTGITGDRYERGQGSFSKLIEDGDAGRHVTLIEGEAIEMARDQFAIDWSPGLHRRNLVTRGIALASLVNHRLQIGDVILRGERTCPPCRHLDKLTGLDAMKSLKSRGGLRTRVVKPGTIRVGDAIVVLEGQR